MPPCPRPPRPKLTHFLSLPLPLPHPSSLPTTLTTLSLSLPPHLTPALRPPSTLHLTLCVLDLQDPTRLARAHQILRNLDLALLWREARDTPKDTNTTLETADRESFNKDTAPRDHGTRTESERGVRITLRGLSSTRNPSRTSVLYAPPVDPKRAIQRFGEAVRARFGPLLEIETPDESSTATAAAMRINNTAEVPEPDAVSTSVPNPSTSASTATSKPKQKQRPLLLHATLWNTVYLPTRSRRDRQRVEIDARDLIEQFKDVVWMEDVRVETLALCRMGAKKDEGGVERYVVEEGVGMP